jgi:hypothetical protein
MALTLWRYGVAFEWSRDGSDWRRHSGDFVAPTPALARAKVVDQLHALGLLTRTVAVYEGERIVMGSPLPLPGSQP